MAMGLINLFSTAHLQAFTVLVVPPVVRGRNKIVRWAEVACAYTGLQRSHCYKRLGWGINMLVMGAGLSHALLDAQPSALIPCTSS